MLVDLNLYAKVRDTSERYEGPGDRCPPRRKPRLVFDIALRFRTQQTKYLLVER